MGEIDRRGKREGKRQEEEWGKTKRGKEGERRIEEKRGKTYRGRGNRGGKESGENRDRRKPRK